jgi:hypothetical protein
MGISYHLGGRIIQQKNWILYKYIIRSDLEDLLTVDGKYLRC